MSIENNVSEPTEDDLYLARMTMDEVGADIEEHGHVAVTDDNRTQDPFTTKGSLANALDEALNYSNPNYDPTNESQGDIEGVTTDPQSPFKSSSEEIKPNDTTMDKAPEVPKTVKDSLTEAFDSVFAMDAVTEVPEEAGDEAHHKWEADEIKKNVPQVPESMGGGDQPDSNGLIYLDYTFTVDPAKYNSPNYQPIADAGMIGNNASNAVKNPDEQAATDKVDEEVSAEETIVAAGGEPSKDAEKVAAKEANENEKEVASIGKPIEEKKTEDEAPEKVVLDYATFIDGSSFMCFDEETGVDYTKIVMDAGPKKPVTRQTCKTTFAQCRAKNPLFCRFHGPKLLEKDIKSAISAALGKGCVVSVTKDKGQKNPLTFRLTIGCPPAMKKDVEKIVHMFMTQNPGISSPEEYKDLGNGKQTTEFDMDILRADEPPKKNDLKGQAAQWKTEQAKESGKTMPVVGDTPPSIEKAVGNGEVKEEAVEEVSGKPPIEPPPQKETLADGDEKKQTETQQPPAEAVEENVDETEGGNVGHKSKQFEILQKTNPMLDSYHTGIHSVEDIKTFEEALDYEAPTYPDITQKLIDKAKSNGKIKVYSSKPIENGVFVSPSEMCAKDYAGDGEVYSKVLPLADIAWISGDEGQVAIVGGAEQDMQQPPVEEVAEKSEEKEEELDEGGNSKGEEITEGMIQAAKEKIKAVDRYYPLEEIDKALSGDIALADAPLKVIQKALGEDDAIYRKISDFSNLHDEAEMKGRLDEFWAAVKAQKTFEDKIAAARKVNSDNIQSEEGVTKPIEATKENVEEKVEQPVHSEPVEVSAERETPPNEEPPKSKEIKSQVKPQKKSAKAKDGTADEIDAAASSIAEKTGENPSAIAQGIEERLEGKKPTTPEEAEMIAAALPEGSRLGDKIKGEAKVEEPKKENVEDKPKKQSRKNRIKIPVKVPKEVERAVEEAESYLENPSGEQSLTTAQTIVSAVEGLKPLDDKVKSIDKVRKEKGRKTSALGRAILTKAEDEAKTSLESAVKRIEELGTTLSDGTKAERYEAELASKSQVRDRVEGVLSSLKSRMFTVGKDGKTISDVSGVVSSTMDDIASYGSELGLDEDVVDNIVKSSRLGILGAELKAASSDMDEAVSATREALGKTGADFHIEDAEHLSGEAMRAISSTGRAFANLRAVANRVKDVLANAKKVGDAKEKLGGEKIDIEQVCSRIEKVYKDWVEDDVPGWVGEMTEANQAAYADILEKAQHSGGMDNGASLDALDAFEKKHMRDGAKKRAAEAEKEKKTDSGEAVGKPDQEESTIPKEARKQALEAAKRLGVDAYKPTDELRKMAIILKPRAGGNPRLEQRLKDLETVLADREAKKDLAPKEMGKYVGDESPNRQIVMDILVEALSNK